jgi:cytochrome c oxidase cbb3-type subunit 3
MPAFGADAILSPTEVGAVAEYVLSLSGKPHDARRAEQGKTLFADNCAACHGEAGAGNREFGAPKLNDAISLYGSDRATIIAQVTQPRHGVMPAWTGRLNETVLKELALYVFSLGGGEAGSK